MSIFLFRTEYSNETCLFVVKCFILFLLPGWALLPSVKVFFFYLSVTLFCLAAVVFPVGFHIAAIGGQPYKLPHHTQVGSAYVLFIMAIFFTVISELFSSRVCLPVL